MIVFFNGNGNVGNIRTNGSATSYNTSSDYRLKENVVGITDGIARVKQLQPKRFNFIADADTTLDGFLAHEAQAVVPEAKVSTTHNQVRGLGRSLKNCPMVFLLAITSWMRMATRFLNIKASTNPSWFHCLLLRCKKLSVKLKRLKRRTLHSRPQLMIFWPALHALEAA